MIFEHAASAVHNIFIAGSVVHINGALRINGGQRGWFLRDHFSHEEEKGKK